MKRACHSLGTLLAVIVVVFLVHHDLLYGGAYAGFYADDVDFLRNVKPLTADHWLSFLSPHWGWFYRPVFLTYFSLMLRVCGPDPVAFHAASLVLHSFVIWLFICLMRRMSGSAWLGIICGVAAVLYPFPDKSQPVGWISAASVLLATLFYLVTLHLFLSWQKQRTPWLYAGALAAFSLALGAKEDALSLPLALMALS